MVVRKLVTTAIEETWPEKGSILFLGEWCRRYNRKEIWESLDSTVMPYHWDDRKKLFVDYQYLQDLYEVILAELTDKLNQIHSVNHSPRYWRILIGPWLGFFIQIIFDRWFMLKQAIEKGETIECCIIDRDPISVVPNDMTHFSKMSIDDDWNEAIYGQLLLLCWGERVNIERVQPQTVDSSFDSAISFGVKTAFKRRVESLIYHFNKLFSKDEDYFFISSYLPLKIDFKLQMRLGQFPKLWRSRPAPITKPDILNRQWRLSHNESKNGSFEYVVRQMISQHIPAAYLEGYGQMVIAADLMAWPKKPKIIFTSNLYESDDLFKSWMAKKSESGTRIVIGQHGGHFGMNPFSFHEEHQIIIADNWLSWGWFDQTRPQITPIGMLKGFGKTVSYDPQGGALMVELGIPRYSHHLSALPVSRQWLDYLEHQKIFLKTLPCKLRKQVLLKLDPHNYGWDQKDRWRDEMPELHIVHGHKNICKLINKSRICISTYNATTYLESLTWNVPTIVFWHPNHWELKEKAKPYFELLRSVGILHETPKGAAKQMIKVWHDVSSWWESDEVQNAREQFCDQFALMPDNPIDELRTLFQDI